VPGAEKGEGYVFTEKNTIKWGGKKKIANIRVAKEARKRGHTGNDIIRGRKRRKTVKEWSLSFSLHHIKKKGFGPQRWEVDENTSELKSQEPGCGQRGRETQKNTNVVKRELRTQKRATDAILF